MTTEVEKTNNLQTRSIVSPEDNNSQQQEDSNLVHGLTRSASSWIRNWLLETPKTTITTKQEQLKENNETTSQEQQEKNDQQKINGFSEADSSPVSNKIENKTDFDVDVSSKPKPAVKTTFSRSTSQSLNSKKATTKHSINRVTSRGKTFASFSEHDSSNSTFLSSTTSSSSLTERLPRMKTHGSKSLVPSRLSESQETVRDPNELLQLKKVFNSVKREGEPGIDIKQWLAFCEKLHLNLDEDEMIRVYESIDTDGSKHIDFDEFVQGVEQFKFLQAFVSKVDDIPFHVSKTYDYSKSTMDNYKLENHELFYGRFESIRKTRDYTYHSNFTKERQLWQDSVLQILTVREDPQPEPWIVYTCGPMGAGKGYALSWMSKHGYFPLEHIVHIDPDYFKSLMPEWEGYVRDKKDAGSLCHRESGFIAEIAQEIAMQNRQHIWVDGSLRDGKWYSSVFDDIRARFPEYSIGIFYVYAPKESVIERARSRAELTGRSVPMELINESFDAPDRSLGMLTHKVDFLARINNQGLTPKLEAYERIDRSGNFSVLTHQFAKTFQSPNKFPNSLAPMRIQKTGLEKTHLKIKRSQTIDQRDSIIFSKSILDIMRPETKSIFSSLELPNTFCSIRSAVNVGTKARLQLKIPSEAMWFAWCDATLKDEKFKLLVLEQSLIQKDPVVSLLMHGGFIYFDLNEEIVSVNAITGFALDNPATSQDDNTFLQFGNPVSVSDRVVECLYKGNYFCPVTLERLLRCRRPPVLQAWIQPGQRFGEERITQYGAFVFLIEDIESDTDYTAVSFSLASS